MTVSLSEIRVGRDCKPLTGTQRRKLLVDAGADDYTAATVGPVAANGLSASALETLREAAAREGAPSDLLRLGDEDLLRALDVVRDGQLTRAGILLAGSPAAIREHAPHYVWTFLRMSSDTNYTDRTDGRDALPVALARILDRIAADNPLQTVRQGLFHFEYRTFPEIALREALLNAFCHADFRIASPILVKQHPERLEISNPGGLIGGIAPGNILHHVPAARNPCLVQALVRLRLINRSNLGMQRIYEVLLAEGKEPPHLEDLPGAFRLTFQASKLSPPFRAFVADQSARGVALSVDHLLVLQHLLRHPEIQTATAATICQRQPAESRETLSRMERDLGYLARGGSGQGAYWTLRPELHARIAAPGDLERDRRLDWEAAKTRVLSVIRQRASQGDEPLANADVRRITGVTRHQARRLIRELAKDGHVEITGHGKGARYVYAGDDRGTEEA